MILILHGSRTLLRYAKLERVLYIQFGNINTDVRSQRRHGLQLYTRKCNSNSLRNSSVSLGRNFETLKELNKVYLIQFKFKRLLSTNDEKSKAGTKHSEKKSLFRKFKSIIDVFVIGIKALYNDVKLAVKTRRKLGLYHKQDLTRLSREELRHMRQTKKDIVKTFPVTLLFMVPFIGYAAPLLAYIYPKQLLSQQFWHPDQKKEFVLEEYEKRSQYYQSLVKEVGITSKEIKSKELLKLCYKILEGNHPTNGELLKFQATFSDHEEFSLKNMPRYHLVKLCRCWLIPTAWYLPRWFLVNALKRRISHLHQDDMLIKRDGIDLLTAECVEEAVHIRGLDEGSLNDIAKLFWLAEWVDLSTSVSSLDLGKDVSFLAHSAVFKAANFESRNKNRDQNDQFV